MVWRLSGGGWAEVGGMDLGGLGAGGGWDGALEARAQLVEKGGVGDDAIEARAAKRRTPRFSSKPDPRLLSKRDVSGRLQTIFGSALAGGCRFATQSFALASGTEKDSLLERTVWSSSSSHLQYDTASSTV